MTSDQAGAFALESIAIGSYTVTAMKAGFAAFRLPSVGVAASATTSVSLTLTIGPDTPGTISGVVTDYLRTTPTPLAGVVVTVEGTTVSAMTDASGAFSIER